MTRIRVHLPEDPTSWESWVDRCGGNALHLPAVHEVEQEPASIQRLLFEDDGDVVACALALEESVGRLKNLLGKRKRLILPTAPAIRDGRHARKVRMALMDHARHEGFDHLVISPVYSQWIVGDEDLRDYRTTAVTEFVLNLSRGEEQARAAMHKNHRKSARRAERDGVEVVEDASLEGLLRLRQLQISSAERAHEKTEGFGVPGEEFFRRLHESVYSTGIGSVLFAYYEGEPIAALAWLQAGKRAQTVRSGSLPEGYRLRAMYLLYADLIHRCANAGLSELNAGGVPSSAAQSTHPQSGLFDFKQGFGGEICPRYGLEIPLEKLQP